jgi:lipopolysaccharide/colanic/teichoic acid biosynthesis glycosyltransferase
MAPSPINEANSPRDAARLPQWKRAMDLAFCGITIPALALVALGVGLLMACTAPGPIFYRQERVGRHGRRFVIHKFRTMYADAATGDHARHVTQLMQVGAPLQKLDARGDPRLIPGGWLLRATGLDELPQILNVLAGEMSVVGPRPCLPFEYEAYTPRQRRRFAAMPGLTGLWQVSGKNRTTFERMITLDLLYARHCSPALDLAIILRTPAALVRQVADIRSARRTANPLPSADFTRTADAPGRTRP